MTNLNTLQKKNDAASHALVIVSHGTKNKVHNEHFFSMVADIMPAVKSYYSCIKGCFLEFAMPSLYKTLQECALENYAQVTIFPYFLVGGKHVTDDIPAIVKKIKQETTLEKITILKAFGFFAPVQEALKEILMEKIR